MADAPVKKATILKHLRDVVGARSTESGERNAVARVLASYGIVDLPEIEAAYSGGQTVRVYIWKDTPWGVLALSSGPGVKGHVEFVEPAHWAELPEGAYAQAVPVSAAARNKILGSVARAVERAAQLKPKAEQKPPAPPPEPPPAPKPKRKTRSRRKSASAPAPAPEPGAATLTADQIEAIRAAIRQAVRG